jgi:hypothetical protein
MKNKAKLCLAITLAWLSIPCVINSAYGQASVGIGVATPHPSAVMEVSSPVRGVSFPKVYLTSRFSTAPLDPDTRIGTVVYNWNGALITPSGSEGFYYYNGQAWNKLLDASAGWFTTGNAGTAPASMGIGTSDDNDFSIWRNNVRGVKVTPFTTVFGNGSASSNTSWNTVFGSSSMINNSRAYDCVAIGTDALKNAGSGNINAGDGNIGIGRAALQDNIIGEKNTAVGAYALENALDSFNTAVGYNAGALVTTGTNNLAIGSNASVGSTLSYAAAIGADAVVSTNNSVVLGGTGAAATKVGIGLTAPSADLDIRQKKGDTAGIKLITSAGYYWRIESDAQGDFNFYYFNNLAGYINGLTGAYVNVSDARLKKNIHNVQPMLARAMKLAPKTYRFAAGGPQARTTYGFLAQDVERLFPEMVATHPVTGMKSIAYQDFGLVAIETIKEQQGLLQQLDQTIEVLSKKLAALEKNSSRK